MAAKLDKSLDEILSSEKLQRRRQRRAARAGAGGARKQKAARAAQQAAPAAAAAPVLTGDSKIIVSGLPSDVDEASIKSPAWEFGCALVTGDNVQNGKTKAALITEYFSKSAGPVKKVILTYNQNGTSRGIASIIFRQPESAAKAAKDLNGMLVDKKPIKIEVVVDPTRVQPAAASSAKSLADRASPRLLSNPQRPPVQLVAAVAPLAAAVAPRSPSPRPLRNWIRR
ncbi:hypothetical protein KEM55_004754 [Ascosphaera atra]|nr:hypothetical protein KEM55_004754 [Ascosphaera atra]